MATDRSIDAVAAPDWMRIGTAQRVAILLAILLVALLPVLLNPLGIGGDYPNHLSRVFIQQELARSEALQEHFTLEWGIYPHLGMDILMGPLMSVLDPYTVGAAFNVAALAMFPLGVMLLSWVTIGRVSMLPAASVLLIYGVSPAWGFINFVFATGAAVILFAGWVYMRTGWARTALFVPLTLILFFAHMLGFLLFCFLALSYETGRFLAGERGSLRRFTSDLLLRDALITALPLVLFAVSFEARVAELDTNVTAFGNFVRRAQAFVAPFDYHGGPETLILFAGFYGCLWVAFVRRWLVLQSAMKPVFLAAVFLVLLVPMEFLGIHLLHVRFGALPAGILLAGSIVTPAGQRNIGYLFLCFAALFALQLGTVYAETSAIDRQQRQMRAVIGNLPTGSRVLIAASDDLLPLMHTPSLAVIEIAGYVPGLFTNTSPVGVSSTAAPIHRPQAGPLNAAELLEGQRQPPPTEPSRQGHGAYFHGWPSTFDALVWLSPDGVPAPQSPHLTEIARGEGFMLYTISPGSRAGRL